jgi:dephospho-CoA kinase
VHLFGLTGGIASGKSTVALYLKERGVPVIDADSLARQVVLPGTLAAEQIRTEFGAAVFAEDGTLDRKALASVVFSSADKRAKLNAITHPKIAVLSAQCASDLRARGEPLACYEAALLVENGLAAAFRPLVVVAAPEATQVARAQARDGSSVTDAEARIRAQMPLDKKVAAADFVIHNDGTLGELYERVDAVLAQVCEKLGVVVSRYPMPEERRLP